MGLVSNFDGLPPLEAKNDKKTPTPFIKELFGGSDDKAGGNGGQTAGGVGDKPYLVAFAGGDDKNAGDGKNSGDGKKKDEDKGDKGAGDKGGGEAKPAAAGPAEVVDK